MSTRRPPALWEDATLSRQIALALPVSLGLHVVLLVMVAVQAFFSRPAELPPPSYEVMLVGPIKKGRPGGGAPAPASAARTKDVPAPKDEPAPPDPDEMAIPVSTPADDGPTPIPDPDDARAEALARIQREAALQRLREEAAKRASQGTADSPIPSAGGAGTQPNAPGGSGDGDGDGGSEYGVDWSNLAGAATYEQQLQAIVTANWIPPTWISDKQPMQVVIRVLIAFDGKIATTRVEQPSGNAAFDASALAALKKSDPFPPPPIDLKPYLAKKGIPLRFDSRMKKP